MSTFAERLEALRAEVDRLISEHGAQTPVALTAERVWELIRAVDSLRATLRIVTAATGVRIADFEAESCADVEDGDAMVMCECGKFRPARVPHGYQRKVN